MTRAVSQQRFEVVEFAQLVVREGTTAVEAGNVNGTLSPRRARLLEVPRRNDVCTYPKICYTTST